MKQSTLDGLNFLVEASLERDVWDELAMLLFTREGEDADTLVLLNGTGNPADALPDIARAIAAGGFPAPTDGVTGIIFFVEAWNLKSRIDEKETLEADVDALHEMGRNVGDHPDATEMKGWYAIDSEGTTARIFERGASEVIIPPKGTSSIPENLKLLLDAVTA